MAPKCAWRVTRDINDYSITSGNERVASYIIARSNAKLIAAAPELLAALKALRANVNQDLSGWWTESTANFMQQADAAIARAEGK